MIFFYQATHNLVSLNGSVLPVKCVARTTRYTNTVIKFVPKEYKTTTYLKTLFHQNLNSFKTVIFNCYLTSLQSGPGKEF